MFQAQVCVGLIELVGYWWIRDHIPELLEPCPSVRWPRSASNLGCSVGSFDCHHDSRTAQLWREVPKEVMALHGDLGTELIRAYECAINVCS